jgi:UDP-3-O-[3-hydroxymyristoyl] glucosamine N-acyltransferase
MADPRFYDNRGPFTLRELCEHANLALPHGVDGAARVFDVAGLTQAGPLHLSFYEGARAKDDFLHSKAGWCIVGKTELKPASGTVLLQAASVPHAFAAAATLFYPDQDFDIDAQARPIHPSASLGENVVLGPGVVIGPEVEIGRGTRIGANSVIGRGVAIGRDCRIGANVGIAFSYLGDEVVVQGGAEIGGAGFGFASSAAGHVKIPQLGRVIVQDRVEIGANSTVDRGALADTVIGEGSKIDNLVQIGHNTLIGRHCIVVGQVGISGSVAVGDYAVLGGMVGVADHVTIGAGARVGGLAGVTRDLEGGRDYGGHPARPIKEWLRETATLAKLARRRERTSDE